MVAGVRRKHDAPNQVRVNSDAEPSRDPLNQAANCSISSVLNRFQETADLRIEGICDPERVELDLVQNDPTTQLWTDLKKPRTSELKRSAASTLFR